MRRERRENSVGVSTWRNVHAAEIIDKAGFRLRVSSHLYWMFESRGIFPRWAFNRKFCRWILHGTKQLSALSNMTRGKGLVITILTSLQGMRLSLSGSRVYLVIFKSVGLINDIKCASALGDCVPLSSATLINIRILLKASSYFSPSLHYVFQIKEIDWTIEFISVWTWNYDYDNTHRPFCRYLITNIITELHRNF